MNTDFEALHGRQLLSQQIQTFAIAQGIILWHGT